MSDLLEVPAADKDLTAFNLKRWDELLADPEMKKLRGVWKLINLGELLYRLQPLTNTAVINSR